MSSKTKAPQDRKAKAEKKSIATAATWGTKKNSGPVDLELPSGALVRVKRVALTELLASGAFPDTLMSIVSEKIESATGEDTRAKEVDPDTVKNVLADPAKLGELFEAMDRVIPLVVEEPVVFYHKRWIKDENGADTKVAEVIPDEARFGEAVYTDNVDLEDKMHIFQFAVGGTREVEDFRVQLSSAVADVSAE